MEDIMKTKLIAATLMLSLASTGVAYAKPSCAKGAVVGGVGGHVAGRHGLLGAAAGCVIGHHMAKKQEREQQRQAQAQANAQAANSQQPAPHK
jgi:membrane protease subunit (stomatin/prohibitin family)